MLTSWLPRFPEAVGRNLRGLPTPGAILAILLYAVNLLLAVRVVPWGWASLSAALAYGCVAALAWRGGASSRAALGAFGASLVFFGGQSYTVHSLILHGAASGLGLGLDLARLGERPRASGRPSLTLALTAVFILAAMTGAVLLPWDVLALALARLGFSESAYMAWFSLADSPWYSLVSLNRLVLYGVLARTLSRLDESRFTTLTTAMALGCAATCLAGLGFFVADAGRFVMLNRLTSTFLNPGWFAEYICLTAPFLLVWLVRGARRRQALALSCLTLMVAGILLAMSRGGWLVFLAVLGAMAWIVRRFGPGGGGGAVRTRRLFLAPLAGGLLAVGALAFASMGPLILKEFLIRLAHFTATSRPAVFLSGVLMGLESPVLGLGYETYAWLHPWLLSLPQSLVSRHGVHGVKLFEATHNLYIQLFAGGGLVLLGLWCMLWWRTVRICLWSARTGRSPASAACALSACAFALFGLFQEMLYIPVVWLVFFLCIARAAFIENNSQDAPAMPRAWNWALAALMVAVAGMAWRVAEVAVGRADSLAVSIRREAPVIGGLFAPEVVGGEVARWSPGVCQIALAGGGPWRIRLHPAGGPGVGAGWTPTVRVAGGRVESRVAVEGNRVEWTVSRSDEGKAVVLVSSPGRFLPFALSGLEHRPLGFTVTATGLPNDLPVVEGGP